MKKTILFLSLISVFNLSYAVDLDVNKLSKNEWDKLSKSQEQQERDFEANLNVKKPQNIKQVAKDYFNKDFDQYTIPHSYYSQKQKLNGYLTCFVNENNESESIFTVDNVVMAGTLEYPETKPFSKAICTLFKRYENERNINVPKVIIQNVIKKEEVKLVIEKPIEQNIIPDNLFIKEVGNFTDIKKLIKEISKIDIKDEFTKKSEIDEKFNQLYLGKEILFKDDSKDTFLSISGNDLKYDPESEVLNFKIGRRTSSFNLSTETLDAKNVTSQTLLDREKHYITLTNERTSGSEYVGSNAFGVRVNVHSSIYLQYGLIIANTIDKKSSSSFFEPQFVINLPFKPNEARDLKDNIGYYYKTELVNPVGFKTKVIEDIEGSGATVDSPTELYVNKKFILVKIKEIGIFNKKTGKVLFIKKV